ncbi:hypothetical protein FRB90_011682 [Tulasnella sp. 427]|nr:hypothetical protein FRB90_011682 [Tulasnella sp. 427]
MTPSKHSELPQASTCQRPVRLGRAFGGQKRLTVAEVAAVVLLHAPGKMLRTSEIATGAQKMFAPRYDDPKALSRFRSSLRHELSKFRDGKFFRVPKEHGRAGRGDLWAYVGDGDAQTLALIHRITQERGHAKDYSKRHHTFEVTIQSPLPKVASAQEVPEVNDRSPRPSASVIPPHIAPLQAFAPTPILHASIQPQPFFATELLHVPYLMPPDLESSPASVASDSFEGTSFTAPSTPLTGYSTTPSCSDVAFADQQSGLFDFSFLFPPSPSSFPPSQPSPLKDFDQGFEQHQYVWDFSNLCSVDQSMPPLWPK